MTEPKMEIMPDASALVEQIQRHEGWNPVYRRSLEELFRSSAFLAALREVLVQSDETLKNIGMTDLTDELAIKKGLRAQGIVQGLTQAVELICELATTPETKLEEKKND